MSETSGEGLFPIIDYDELRVSEILPLLEELYDDELQMVAGRERATKGRVTILDRIAEIDRLESSTGVAGALERLLGVRGPSLTLLAGVLLTLAGAVAIGLAWYHAGNTDQVWIQTQEVVSGGFGGMALVVVGTGLIVRDQIAASVHELGEQLRYRGGIPATNGARPSRGSAARDRR